MLFTRPTACTTFSFSFLPFAFNSIHSMTELGVSFFFYYYSAFSYLAVVFFSSVDIFEVDRTVGGILGACLYRNDPFRKEPCWRAASLFPSLFSCSLPLAFLSSPV